MRARKKEGLAKGKTTKTQHPQSSSGRSVFCSELGFGDKDREEQRQTSRKIYMREGNIRRKTVMMKIRIGVLNAMGSM